MWHLPDFFGEEGWGSEQFIADPVFLAVEFAALFFARVLFVWFYDRSGSSVLLVAMLHASFDASISELSYDVIPGSNVARFLLFSAVIAAAATAVMVLTRGRFAGASSSPVIPPACEAARAVPVHRQSPARARTAIGDDSSPNGCGSQGAGDPR